MHLAANRTSNFIVGLTNISPDESPPTIGRYTVCGQGPKDMLCCSPNQTYYVTCAGNQPPARYVIIQLQKTAFLNFCELEVYGEGLYICIDLLDLLGRKYEDYQLRRVGDEKITRTD